MSAPTQKKSVRPFSASSGPGRPFIAARHPGHCHGCGEPFFAGEQITRVYGRGGWFAECCAAGAGGAS